MQNSSFGNSVTDTGDCVVDGSCSPVTEFSMTAAATLRIQNVRPGQTVKLIVTTDSGGPYAFTLIDGQAITYAGSTSGLYPAGPSKVTVFEFTGRLSGGVVASNLTTGNAVEFFPDVIICNGQSNAAATAPGTLGYSAMTALLGSDILGWSDLAAAFVAMVDGGANMRAATGGANPGPGGGQVLTRIARRVANATGKTVRTFAAAYTSQAISYFLPSSVTNAFYSDGAQASVNNWNLILNAVTASGVSPKMYLFIQGEANTGDSQAAYFASLETFYLAVMTAYPTIEKFAIVLTIGEPLIAGVQAAQRQLAATYSNVLLLDNSDLDGETAWFYQTHYTSYAGYKLVADRLWAIMQGQTFPAVPLIPGIQNLAAWEKAFQYNTLVQFTGGRNQVLAWNDNVVGGAANQLLPGANQCPTLMPSNAITERPSVNFLRSNLETLSRQITQDGGDWTFFMVTRNLITSAGPVGTKVCLYDTGTGERLGLDEVGSSNLWSVLEGGGDLTNSGPTCDLDWHTHMVVLDSTGLVCRWYIDGALSKTTVMAGTQTPTNPTLYFGSNIGAVSFITSEEGGLWFKTGIPATVAEEATLAASLHSAASIEYENLR